MSPQIQEPDERFWTPLRGMFVVLSTAGLIFLASRGFVSAPPNDAALPAASATSPAIPPKNQAP